MQLQPSVLCAILLELPVDTFGSANQDKQKCLDHSTALRSLGLLTTFLAWAPLPYVACRPLDFNSGCPIIHTRSCSCVTYPALSCVQLSYRLMEQNANAFVTLKLASAWLAMRLDLLGLMILTGCGALVSQPCPRSPYCCCLKVTKSTPPAVHVLCSCIHSN